MSGQEMINILQSVDTRTRQRIGIVLAAVLIVLVGLSAMNSRISALEKKRAAREADVADMMRLKFRYQMASMVSQQLQGRLMATKPDDSPAKVIEEIGIKGRNSQIKPAKGDDIPGYQEDAADVKIEGLSANEATNLIYRIEKGTRPVTIKKAYIKQRFDDASKVDVSLTIALIKPAPAGIAGAQ
jgi:general secretion pathway protein M